MPATLPVVKGTLDVLVLKALSWTPMHGFEIVKWMEEQSGGSLDIDDSALYQALYRMEARGLIQADWGVTTNNRRARYYTLTRAGRSELRTQSAQLLRYAKTLTALLSASPQSAS